MELKEIKKLIEYTQRDEICDDEGNLLVPRASVQEGFVALLKAVEFLLEAHEESLEE